VAPAALESLLAAGVPEPDRPRLLDVRDRGAYRRSHLRGAANVPGTLLPERLFLLPPRARRLLVIGPGADASRRAASLLAGRGFRELGWLDGNLGAVPPSLLTSGAESVRLWEPSPWLARQEGLLPREGPAADLACGSGRDAVYLALGGRSVLGLDILPDAVRQARILAREARIEPPGRATFRLADLEDLRSACRWLRSGRFSVLTCFRYLDRRLLPFLAGALAPGGVLLYQTFLEEQARRGGRPRRPEYLLMPGELLEAFPDLEVLAYDEGTDQDGSWLASVAGRKPAAAIVP
jgi:SAM-dependent methyltransferase